MSFLKQILKPFVDFDPDKKVEPVREVVEPKQPLPDEPVHHPLVPDTENKAPVPSTVTTAKATLPTNQNGTDPLPEHVAYFDELINKANNENPLFKGADFKEFIDAKLDIDDIADENLRYKTAFNILKSSGLTKEKLLSTGQDYLNIIGRDLNAFLTAHAQQYKKELSQKELHLKTKAEELQVLTQRLSALKGEINQVSREINQSQSRLNTTKNSFLLAGEKKQHEIQTELNKIANHFG